ncbi:MAG TPA: glycosyltransferase family 9 protein [Sedimentisphaerales bacterium]|nr:glycosyltransferase family 9 protein [Sedimentisphaerales bacterium]
MHAREKTSMSAKESGAKGLFSAERGLILQPGAIGDCILTLPLGQFMKDALGLDAVDVFGHTDYLGIFPGRTCIDRVRSIDSIGLHRLFAKTSDFHLEDRDPLIRVFSDYCWIVTFLGGPNTDFERNLIFTVNCGRSAEVITLPVRPSKRCASHLTDFYVKRFVRESGMSIKAEKPSHSEVLIRANQSDVTVGRELLEEIGVSAADNLAVLHPGSGGVAKCWHLDNFLTLAGRLASKNVQVIFLLGPAELDRLSKKTITDLSSLGKCLVNLSLSRVVGLFACADVFLGNDTGLTHLAAAAGVKTIAVFGPTNPKVYGPVGPHVTILAGTGRSFAARPSSSLQKQVMAVLSRNLGL